MKKKMFQQSWHLVGVNKFIFFFLKRFWISSLVPNSLLFSLLREFEPAGKGSKPTDIKGNIEGDYYDLV